MFTRQKNSRTYPNATRVVKTTRWIHRNQLKVGMYVRELDCPWEDTPFMFQGFLVDSPTLLQEVQDVAQYVCVESEKLAQVSSDSALRLCGGVRT